MVPVATLRMGRTVTVTYSTKTWLFVLITIISFAMSGILLRFFKTTKLQRGVPKGFELPTRPMLEREWNRRVDEKFKMLHVHYADGGCAGPGCR
jgi:hypothetical protein